MPGNVAYMAKLLRSSYQDILECICKHDLFFHDIDITKEDEYGNAYIGKCIAIGCSCSKYYNLDSWLWELLRELNLPTRKELEEYKEYDFE